MKRRTLILALIAALVLVANPVSTVTTPAQATSVLKVTSQVAGTTPFVEFVTLGPIDFSTFTAVSFSIAPKPGASAKAASASYSKAYLQSRGYLNTETKTIRVPVVGLYQGYSNTVTLKVTQGFSTTTLTDSVVAAAWSDPRYLTPTFISPRNKSVALDYSYMLLKNWAGGKAPTIIDVDGELRWVGNATEFPPVQASDFQDNGILYGSGTSLIRMELDGTYQLIKDYSVTNDVTKIGHHNYQAGKTGTLIEVDTNAQLESTILEVDKAGAVINTFDLAEIIETAMLAGGDDPNTFVRRDADWFHNNSTAYWRASDTLVVSSRENFVIGIDYTTKAIKWILGDPTKFWHSFSSLRAFELTLAEGSVAPAGQHAVSITTQGELMLFDNGTASFNQPAGAPVGVTRGFAAPRRYTINEGLKTAIMTWSFEHGESVFSPICSSIYQDGSSYLIDYASVDWGQSVRLLGLGANDQVAFEFSFAGNWEFGWNAQPVHIENMAFFGPNTISGALPATSVIFAARSSALTAAQKARLRSVARSVPAGAKVIRVEVTSAGSQALAISRDKRVAAYLRALGVVAKYTLKSGKGKASSTDRAALRVTFEAN
jgi:hypothetical protein